MGTWSFPGVECGRGVTLTPLPLLVLRSKNRIKLYLYSPYGPSWHVKRVKRTISSSRTVDMKYLNCRICFSCIPYVWNVMNAITELTKKLSMNCISHCLRKLLCEHKNTALRTMIYFTQTCNASFSKARIWRESDWRYVAPQESCNFAILQDFVLNLDFQVAVIPKWAVCFWN
jgi:hypothetical protein